MQELSIPEGNKLIELFYYSPQMTANGDWIIRNDQQGTKQHISTLKYHEDWNNLMRVIEKIGLIKIDDYESYQNTFYPRTFGMRNEEGEYMFRFNASTLFISKSFIKAAWLAVVDFIQWYNRKLEVYNNCPHQECEQPEQCKKANGCVHDVQ